MQAYAISFEDLPDVYRKANSYPIEAYRSRRWLWDNYGVASFYIGAFTALLGISMIPVEVSRIIAGSLNRGTSGAYFLYPNYNADKNSASVLVNSFQKSFIETNLANKGIVAFSATNAAGKTGSNYPIQDKYIWPWSHPALLFSLVIILAGLIGILSSYRRTYTSIFALFTTSLFAMFFCIFLITYYSIHAHWHLYFNNSNNQKSTYSSIDRDLGLAMLTLSTASCLLSAVSVIYSALSLGIFRGPKAPLVKWQKPIEEKKKRRRMHVYYY